MFIALVQFFCIIISVGSFDDIFMTMLLAIRTCRNKRDGHGDPCALLCETFAVWLLESKE